MLRLLRLPLLALLLSAAVPAAELVPVVTVTTGAGLVDGHATERGTTVALGQIITAADAGPLQLDVVGSPDSSLIVAAGSEVRLQALPTAAGQADLLLEVLKGAVQVDLASKRPWRELRVQGGALDVQVVGTLFMFERVRRDQDYLAMVRGKVKVRLLGALAAALGQTQGIDLEGGQGLGGSGSGFGRVTTLGSTPSIGGSAAARAGLQDQSLGGGNPVDQAILDQLNTSVVEGVTQSAVQQVIQSLTDGGPTPLPGPPAHP